MPEASPSHGRLPGQWFYATYAVLVCAITMRIGHFRFVLPVWGLLAWQIFAPGLPSWSILLALNFTLWLYLTTMIGGLSHTQGGALAFFITAPTWIMLSLTIVGSGIYHPWRERILPANDRPALRRPGTWVLGAVAFVALFGFARARLSRPRPTPQQLAVGRIIRTRTDLNLLRSAVSDFKRETKALPADLNDVRRGVYLRARGFPPALTSHHPDADAVQIMTSEDLAAGRFSDAGGWAYVAQGDAMGKVFVNCTHAEPGQQAWNSY